MSAPLPSSKTSRGAFLLIACAIVATFFYYRWTDRIFYGDHAKIDGRRDDHFNLLSHGFQKGHLYLDKEVPAALLASKNPYDPEQRKGISVPHDSSYYQGHYYIYFGPAPIVTLFLPFTLLTGHDLPTPQAILVYCFGGYLALLAAFLTLRRRYFPSSSNLTLLACLLVLGGGTMILALMRRPNIWEVSGSAGFFFFSCALLCLIKALPARRPWLWTALGGLALGLAVASRPSYLVASLMFALPLLFRSKRSDSPSAYSWGALFAAAVPCTLIVLGLFGYNYARFNDPLEFGQRYQLSSIIEGDAKHFSFSYLPYNLYIYGYSCLRWFGAFPFVRPIVTPPEPDGYGDQEFSFGLLPQLPFIFFAFAVVAALFVRRLRANPDDARWPAFGVVLSAGFLTFAPLSVFFGSCVRYMADFTPSFMLLACLGLLEIESHLSARPRTARLLGQTALVLAVVSVIIPFLATVDAYDIRKDNPPAAYATVGNALNAPIRWIDRLVRPNYRPWDISVTFAAQRGRRREPLMTVRKYSELSAVLFVEYLDGDLIRFGYHESPSSPDTVFSPAIEAKFGVRYPIRITIGDIHEPLENGTRSWVRMHFNGRFIWETPSASPDGFPGHVHIGGSVPPSARAGTSFTGIIHSAAPAPDRNPSPASQPPLGARLRLELRDWHRDRSFPLAATGISGKGDILFVKVTKNDELIFGYDHWAHPSFFSAPIPVKLNQDSRVEFWLPTLAPGGATPPLIVKLDGKEVWRVTVPHYPHTPNQIYFGYNPLGGSSSEAGFDGGIVETTDLPFAP